MAKPPSCLCPSPTAGDINFLLGDLPLSTIQQLFENVKDTDCTSNIP